MSEMVEKVAKALERLSCPEWTDEQFDTWWNKDPRFCEHVTGWTNFRGTKKGYAIFKALAALGAMREPTLPMLNSGVDNWSETITSEDTFPYTRGTWRAMIDAAIEVQA